ncbi:MAG: hypothetical protein R3F20_16740 [Planctomycetota bacterium]
MHRTAGRLEYLGIGLIAASVIAFELALTRIFAILLWHHLTYMVFSIAMLGFGAAGTVLAIRPASLRAPQGPLAWLSAAYALTVPMAVAGATSVRIDCLALFSNPSSFVALLIVYGIVALPLFIAGLVIGLALTRFRDQAERVYAADLVGSAIGGGLALWGLGQFGAVTTTVGAAALGALAGLAFAARRGGLAIAATAIVVAALAFFLVGLRGGSVRLGVPALEWTIPFAPGKEFNDDVVVDRRIPSAVAEVEVAAPRSTRPMIGGDFGTVDRMEIPARLVGQDGTAPTMLFEGASDLAAFPFLDDSQTSSGYRVLQASERREPDVLVIGVGGGVDVMVALAEGARSVTAVEANPAMVRMVREDYDAWLGGLFRPGGHALSDRIELVTAEGRSYLARSEREFDLIQLSGVDSFTALTSGAYTLSESYLYTVEAVRDLYARLRPGGVIGYSRFLLSHPQRPRETLRLAAVAREALAREGVDEPASQIVVFRGLTWASTLIKRGAFSEAEIAALHAFAEREGFYGMIFDPLDARREFAPAPQPVGIVRDYFRTWLGARCAAMRERPDLDAVADDLGAAYLARFADRAEEAAARLAAGVERFPEGLQARVALELESELQLALEAGDPRSRSDAVDRAAFATVLRGDDAELARFHADYPYEVRPAHDDRPFFFDYYRWSSAFASIASGRTDSGSRLADRYHSDFPVAHAILSASLLQIGLLAALLILLPLRRLGGERGERPGGAARDFAYFAALGLGFMAVEITLIQKLVVFVGDPTATMATVVVALLASAGVGSRVAESLSAISRGRLLGLGLVIAIAIAASVPALRFLADHGLGWSFPARIAAAIGVLAPLGLAMGTAFPTGLRILARRDPRRIPWAWGVNGFCSVLGSILAIVVAQQVGFERVLFLSAGLYLIGFAAMAPAPRGVPVGTPPGADAA